jgi:alanyl-tRNA synthetase
MSTEEIARVEDVANAVIRDDLPVETREMPLDEAKRSGAMAHFEEEYKGKERVRVVSVGEFSRELCGGTHVARSGEIGFVKIVSEESVAAGTRRIRAVTGEGAIDLIRAQQALLEELKGELGEDPLEGLARLRAELATLRRRADEMSDANLRQRCDELLASSERVDGISLIARRLEMEAEEMKRLADLLEERAHPAVILLVGEANGRGIAVCKASQGIAAIDAGALVRTMAKRLGGGGGGNRTFAQGGGPQVANIDRALAEGVAAVRTALTG